MAKKNYGKKAKDYGNKFANSGKYTYSVGKRMSKSTYQKMAQKKTMIALGIVLMVALVAPAVAGLYMDSISDIGVNTVIASNCDENSSIVLLPSAYFIDGTNKYTLDTLDSDGLTYFLTGTTDTYVSSTQQPMAYLTMRFNSSEADKIDKIRVYIDSDDVDMIETNSTLTVNLHTASVVVREYSFEDLEYDNETGSIVAEFIFTPDVLLKLQDTTTFYIDATYLPSGAGNTFYYCVQVIDSVGVDSSTTKDMMFGGSGIVLLIGAFACTPYFNPTELAGKIGRRIE